MRQHPDTGANELWDRFLHPPPLFPPRPCLGSGMPCACRHEAGRWPSGQRQTQTQYCDNSCTPGSSCRCRHAQHSAWRTGSPWHGVQSQLQQSLGNTTSAFASYVRTHGKSYNASTLPMRRAAFVANLNYIVQENAKLTNP